MLYVPKNRVIANPLHVIANPLHVIASVAKQSFFISLFFFIQLLYSQTQIPYFSILDSSPEYEWKTKAKKIYSSDYKGIIAKIKAPSEFKKNLEEELAWANESEDYGWFEIDLNNDKKADAMICKTVYFGPSEGIRFFAIEGNSINYLFDGSGTLVNFKQLGDIIYLQFQYNILDSEEANVLITISFNTKSNIFNYLSKIYYAQQTDVPKSLLSSPITFITTASKTELRYSTELSVPKPKEDDPIKTKTLTSNIVGYFSKGSKGYILNKTTDGKWAFIVFEPQSQPIECSLKHGMDKEKEKVWRAGWIQRQFIK